MCSLSEVDTAIRAEVGSCHKRSAWLKNANERTPLSVAAAEHSATKLLDLLNSSCGDLLLWIDGADVATMRAVVAFAKATGVTIQVGQSVGAAAAKHVMLNDGWMGTTLAEISTHADLVVTLGDRALTEAPLLPKRFFDEAIQERTLQWWHISSTKELPVSDMTSTMPHRHLVWPREDWLQRLTELQIGLNLAQHDDKRIELAKAQSLADAFRSSKYSVWLWENSEFTSPMDELVIRRLLSLARQLTLKARCSLLNLESHLGQITAEEVLMWLTGCSGEAQWSGKSWVSPPPHGDRTNEELRARFSKIVLVRTTPTLSPLPDVNADLFVLSNSEGSAPSGQTIWVETAGVDAEAHLFRGDRALAMRCGQSAEHLLPSACDVFVGALDHLAHNGVGQADVD